MYLHMKHELGGQRIETDNEVKNCRGVVAIFALRRGLHDVDHPLWQVYIDGSELSTWSVREDPVYWAVRQVQLSSPR
ncbi:hypothetical protein J6590_066218 [Homalodisca vitripennis]|nr:hypothetical protein J6590_066218 [Homalodisca vitripennis]